MTDRYRSVMEVLKWVEPKTVLESAAGVSALWTRVTDSNELWFSYTEALDDMVDRNLLTAKARYRDAVKYAHTDRIIHIVDRRVLRVFQYTSGTFLCEFTTLPNIAAANCTFGIISNSEGFACGGTSKSAYLFSLLDGTVTPLPSMINNHNLHSVLFCYRKVYVFGGIPAPTSKTAEYFDLGERKWWALPDMKTGRMAFNACFRDKKIYLCGGWGTAECEVFDTLTLQYASLGVPLAKEKFSVSFFYDNQLVTIIKDTAYFFEHAAWRAAKLDMTDITFGYSSAVVYGHFVYIPMNFGSSSMKIDMDTLKGAVF